jgi:hypothetical protein
MKRKATEEKVFVRRFWTDFAKAKEAAHLLFRTLDIKETVYIFLSRFGIFETKQEQFSLRLESEGIRTDSDAIVYNTDLTHVLSEFNARLSA